MSVEETELSREQKLKVFESGYLCCNYPFTIYDSCHFTLTSYLPLVLELDRVQSHFPSHKFSSNSTCLKPQFSSH